MPVRRLLDSAEQRRQELARTLPDVPRWVEARGLLLSGDGEAIGPDAAGGGFLVRRAEPPLLCVIGDPAAAAIRAAADSRPAPTILAPPETSDHAAAALPEWRRRRAVIHILPHGVEVAAPDSLRGVEVRMLAANEVAVLAHLPVDLRREIAGALGFTHVAAAFAGGVAAAFCYCASETETLWDVSIDTLPPYRRRGLAGVCVAFLAGHMARHGKSPVWGAMEDNPASLGLAARLGFEPVDRLDVFTR